MDNLQKGVHENFKQLEMKGRSLEALGQYAIAVGGDDFATYFNLAMNCVIDIMQTYVDAEPSILEFAFVFVANIAKAMEKHGKFKRYLSILIPRLQKSVVESFSERIQIAALTALGSLANYTQGLFIAYLDSTLDVLGEAVSSANPEVQGKALRNLYTFVIVAGSSDGLSNPAGKKGEVLTIHGRVSITLHRVMEWLWTVISKGTNFVPVTCALEALKDLVGYIGIVAMTVRDITTFHTYGDLLKDKIFEYLDGKAPCQLSLVTQNDDEGEDDHHDKHVLPSVCEVIECLAKASGNDYLETFELYIPLLLKFTEDSRFFSDSSMVIGSFANVICEIGAAAVKHVGLILPVLQRDCHHDAVTENRRNACYCLAVIVDSLPVDILEQLIPRFLEWMLPLAIRSSTNDSTSDKGDADVDNAVAAISRIIRKCPEHERVSELLPVVLLALPLTSDFEESVTVYNMLIVLVMSIQPTTSHAVKSYLGDILKVFGQALSDESPYPESTGVKKSVTICLQSLSSSTCEGNLNVHSALDSLSLLPENADVVKLIKGVFLPNIDHRAMVLNDDDKEK